MGVFETIMIILEAVCSVALIVVVLLQSGKESGLSGALSGNNDTYLNKNKGKNMDQMLATSTKWIALAWILATLAMSLI